MAFTFRGENAYNWYTGLVLMVCYALGELGHFLIGVVSKPMAQSIHFGDQSCMITNSSYNDDRNLCTDLNNETKCLKDDVNQTAVCKWDYTGSGVEYQLLAGPYFVAIFTVMGVVLGALGDTFNRIRILSLCIVVYSILTFLTGFAVEYWQVALLRLGFGAAEAGLSPLSASIIADTFAEASRGLAMSVFNWGIYFGFGMAFAVGNLVTGSSASPEGWRWSYRLAGPPGVVLAVLVLLTVKEPERKNITIKKNTLLREKKFTDEEQKNETEELSKKPHIARLLHGVVASVKFFATKPAMLCLLLGACIRHSASFCFAYNAQLFFNHYYPETNLGLWMGLSSIIGGTIGIASGGLISDVVVRKHGVITRLWVLVISQALASPFAIGVLYIPPPYCFLSLIAAYLFAEMWFGILFAVLVELLPTSIRSTSLGMFFFVINNIAGATLLLVPHMKHNFGFRITLVVLYPGFYLISAVVFLVAQLLLRYEYRRQPTDELTDSKSGTVDTDK